MLKTWLQWVGTGCVGGLIAAALGGEAQRPAPKLIEAKQFILVDDAGRHVASLFSTDDGARLSMYDRAGKAKVILAVDEQSGSVIVGDTAGDQTASMMVTSKGALVSVDGPGKSEAMMAVAPGRDPNLEMRDSTGRYTFQAVRPK